MPARVAAGLFVAAVSAFPQYTISARPGAVNYVEGTVTLDGKPLPARGTAQMFLAANDTLTTTGGKAEVLLTPGVFVRLAENAEIRMVSARLTDTSVEVTKGEAIVEVAELTPDNNIQVLDHGAAAKLQKTGLYLFRAGDDAVARVFEGKAAVDVNGNHFDLGRNHELALVDSSKTAKFDAKSGEDDLYAWSKIRDAYDSASSYDASKRAHANSFDNGLYDAGYIGGGYGPGYGMGYGMGYNQGWLWNSGFNSWAWLPGDGAFFSPFGFGYYAPGFVSYAPVAYLPLGYGGGIVTRPVPVNPTKPVQIAGVTAKPVLPRGSSAWAYSGVGSHGGHVTGSSFVAHSSAGGSSAGNGAAASSAGGGHSSISSSGMSSASHSSGGSSAGGGGSHK
jgi:hypothetical protein